MTVEVRLRAMEFRYKLAQPSVLAREGAPEHIWNQDLRILMTLLLEEYDQKLGSFKLDFDPQTFPHGHSLPDRLHSGVLSPEIIL